MGTGGVRGGGVDIKTPNPIPKGIGSPSTLLVALNRAPHGTCPRLDMISMGPALHKVHTLAERLAVASVTMLADLLLET